MVHDHDNINGHPAVSRRHAGGIDSMFEAPWLVRTMFPAADNGIVYQPLLAPNLTWKAGIITKENAELFRANLRRWYLILFGRQCDRSAFRLGATECDRSCGRVLGSNLGQPQHGFPDECRKRLGGALGLGAGFRHRSRYLVARLRGDNRGA